MVKVLIGKKESKPRETDRQADNQTDRIKWSKGKKEKERKETNT